MPIHHNSARDRQTSAVRAAIGENRQKVAARVELGTKNVTELPFEAAERVEIAEKLSPRRLQGRKSPKGLMLARVDGCESRQRAATGATAGMKIAKSLRNDLTQGCELVFFMLDAHIIPGRWRAGFGATGASEL